MFVWWGLLRKSVKCAIFLKHTKPIENLLLIKEDCSICKGFVIYFMEEGRGTGLFSRIHCKYAFLTSSCNCGPKCDSTALRI